MQQDEPLVAMIFVTVLIINFNSLVWFMFLRLTMLGLINVEIALRIGFTELNNVSTSVNTATSS